MKTFFLTTILCFLIPFCTCAQHETKLTSPDGRNGDMFGEAVSISGDVCVVGEPGNTAWPYWRRGTVYSFKRNSQTNNWDLINYIDGDFNSNYFGIDVCMENNNIIVGTYLNKFHIDPAPARNSNYAKILQLDEEGYFSGNHFTFSDTVYSHGSSVAIYNDKAVIGSPFDNENGTNSGAAYIYKKEGGIWHIITKLIASDGLQNSLYGASVAISGKYIVIGCREKNRVYIYEKVGDEWQESIINPSDVGFMSYYFSVSVFGDNIIVGCPKRNSDRESGAAFIYKLESGEWRKTKLLTPNDNLIEEFGIDVCINDSIAVVGAASRYREGACYVYKREGEEWNEILKLQASDGFINNLFGQSVSLCGDNIIVGSPGGHFCINQPIGHDECLEYSRASPGAAYIYEGVFSGYLSISKTALDFENVEVGQSISRLLTINNEGLENLNVSSLSFSGTGAASFSTEFNSVTVLPGESQNILIRFSPHELGIFEASLEIESDGASKSISLIGNGSRTLSVSSYPINFGEVKVGEKPSKNLYIGNIGENSLTIDTLYIESSSPADTVFKFDVELPITIYAEGSRHIPIEFEPLGNADYSATVKISSSVGDETVALLGTGYKAGIPQVWPDTIFFGRARLGENITKPLTIGNLGADPIKVGPVTITGSGAGDFRIDKDTMTVTNNPQIIYVSFFPGAEGVVSAKLNTNTNAGNHEIILTGSGIAEGYLDVTPDTLQFGDEKVQVGSSKQLFVGNFGAVDVQVSSINMTGPDAASFFVDATSLNLAPADITRLNIAFIPSFQGQHSANLELISDGGNISVPLNGNGIICTPEEKTVVFPSDGENGLGGFGYSVSISGNKAIIGGYLNQEEEGAAYIFGCNGTTWEQQEKLRPSIRSLYMDFGRSVDISGNYAIVGAPNYRKEERGRLEGAAFVYSKQFMAGWNEVDMLEVEKEFVNANFGQSVAIDEMTAIIGAPGAYLFPNENEGAAYIFHGAAPAGGDGWEMLEKLTAYDGTKNYGFGTSVDISGNYAIVGTKAYGAYMFTSSSPTGGGAWHFMQKLVSSDFHPNDWFGYNVSISGDYALISAANKPYDSMAGAVYAFKRIGVEWVEISKITSPSPSYQEIFGNSLSLSGDFALIGTRDKETVYLFQRVNDNTWNHIETIMDDGIDPADGFGNNVKLDADSGKGIIGVSGDFANNVHSGSAYIYSAFHTALTSMDEPKMLDELTMLQNYPNPFSTSTILSFRLSRKSNVSLKVYNVIGEEVETIVNSELIEGNYQFHFDAGDLPNGIYLCKLRTGESINVRKILLIK